VIRAAFLSFYRSLTRHPLYSALNLLGLSFGIAVFIVLSLFVRFETSYEQWLPNADRIYEVVHWFERAQSPPTSVYYASPGYAVEAMRGDDPKLLATLIFPVDLAVGNREAVQHETGQIVDADFFKVFDIPIIFGDREAALAAPDGVLVSESMARKYFGRINVVGETMVLRDDVIMDNQPGKETRWRVLAVIKDIPKNSTLSLDIVRSIAAFRARIGMPYLWYNWGTPQRGRTFMILRFGESADQLKPKFQEAIGGHPIPYPRTVVIRLRAALRIGILPFRGQHLSDRHLAATLSGLRITAWLALVVALTNYVNLATARSRYRIGEATLRKVHGASALQIGGQLLVEALLAGFISLILAFSFVEVSLPVLNRVGNLSLDLDYGRTFAALLKLSLAVISGTLLAGVYPAALLLQQQVVSVLGASKTSGRSLFERRFREGLTIVQFVIAGAFLIAIVGFAAQLRHMQTSDLGYSRDKLLTSDSLITSQERREQVMAVIKAWRETEGIVGVTSGPVPGIYYSMPVYFVKRADRLSSLVKLGWNDVSLDFFKVYRTPILVGRYVDQRDDALISGRLTRPEDADKRRVINVDINVLAVKALGFKTPEAALGSNLLSEMATLHIVGVVPTQRFEGPMWPQRPMLYCLTSAALQQDEAVIRYDGIDEATARQRLDTAWRKSVPGVPLVLHSISEELDYYYRDDRRNTRLFAIGGGMAALIGAVGLFGMAAFNTSARVHEIGIRKAQGASRWRIMRLLMFQFLRPVLIANIIAWPIAYVVLDAWLKQFDDRVAMSPFFFLAGSGLSLLIAAATVFGVAWSGANLSPAKALRQL